MSNDIEWDEFTINLVKYMMKLSKNEISMIELWKFIEENECNIGVGLLSEDISNAISEIDGFQQNYLGLIEFLKKRPSRLELAEFMNSPD